MTRRAVIALALALTAALAAPAPDAAAHDRKWRTTASWGLTASGGEAAVGWVQSPHAPCVNDRVVKVFRVKPGRDALVGVDRRTGWPTGSGEGYINAPADLVAGKKYYIVVKKKNIGPRGHKHVCKAWTSGKVAWNPPS